MKSICLFIFFFLSLTVNYNNENDKTHLKNKSEGYYRNNRILQTQKVYFKGEKSFRFKNYNDYTARKYNIYENFYWKKNDGTFAELIITGSFKASLKHYDKYVISTSPFWELVIKKKIQLIGNLNINGKKYNVVLRDENNPNNKKITLTRNLGWDPPGVFLIGDNSIKVGDYFIDYALYRTDLNEITIHVNVYN